MPSANSTTHSKVKVFSRVVKLTYLQSQQVRGGGRDMGDLAGEGGGVGSVTSGSSDPGSVGMMGIGGEGASSFQSQSSDSGWIITRVWDETYFDKVAYRIGLRDVGIFNYTFAQTSELVSIPYHSPKPISKVSLRVVEQIPAGYPIGPRYIEYYVSADDGRNWLRINPLDHPTLVDEQGQTVPRTITFNPDIGGDPRPSTKFVETEKPVMNVRVRIVLRGSSEIDNPQSYTPFCSRYRVLIYPVGGLSANT
jgi:hypothetical protein